MKSIPFLHPFISSGATVQFRWTSVPINIWKAHLSNCCNSVTGSCKKNQQIYARKNVYAHFLLKMKVNKFWWYSAEFMYIWGKAGEVNLGVMGYFRLDNIKMSLNKTQRGHLQLAVSHGFETLGKSRCIEDKKVLLFWKRALLLKLHNDNTQGALSEQKEWKACLAFLDFSTEDLSW